MVPKRYDSLGAHLLTAWRGNRTQNFIGQLFGSDLTTVSKIERGYRKPGRVLALRIAKATGGFVPVETWDMPPPVEVQPDNDNDQAV
jgi:transcriptional regulator with XRE-family HTH domain